MYATHASCGLLEPRPVQFFVALSVLAKVDHFMGDAGEERNGMPVMVFADPNEGHPILNTELCGLARIPADMKPYVVALR